MLSPSFLVFMIVYAVSIFLACMFKDWFMVWMGLEMNMMSFMGAFYFSKDSQGMESLYKYFFVQSMASGMFLVMMYTGGWVLLVFMIKLAAGPFYFWFISVVKGMSWWGCYFLMSFQKLLPLVLVSSIVSMSLKFMGVLSLVVGVVGSFGQSNLRSLMAYSSINHVGWMLLSMVLKGEMWFYYFILYMLVMFPLIYFFWENDMSVMGSLSNENLVILVILMMSMAGMPPLLGFVMKWMILMEMVVADVILSLGLIFSSLIMFYVYSRMSYENMMGGVSESWFKKDFKSGGWMMVNVLTGSMILPVLGFLFFY